LKTVEIELPDSAFFGLDREAGELAHEAAAAVKWYEIGGVSQEVAA